MVPDSCGNFCPGQVDATAPDVCYLRRDLPEGVVDEIKWYALICCPAPALVTKIWEISTNWENIHRNVGAFHEHKEFLWHCLYCSPSWQSCCSRPLAIRQSFALRSLALNTVDHVRASLLGFTQCSVPNITHMPGTVYFPGSVFDTRHSGIMVWIIRLCPSPRHHLFVGLQVVGSS